MRDRNTQCGRKNAFFEIVFIGPTCLFKPIISYYIMDIGPTHAHGYVSIPILVYKSLDVSTPYFANFVSEIKSGHVVTVPLGARCNTLTVEQIGRILGVNRGNYDASTKVGM